MTEKNVESLKTFTNKQVLSIVGVTAFVVFTAAGIWGTFNTMSSKITTLESDIKLLEKSIRHDHDNDLKNLRSTGEMGFELMQKAIDASQELQSSNYESLYQRVSTIRDRNNIRFEKLEESNSDKK